MCPNATLGASDAPNATLGASHAPNATLGHNPHVANPTPRPTQAAQEPPPPRPNSEASKQTAARAPATKAPSHASNRHSRTQIARHRNREKPPPMHPTTGGTHPSPNPDTKPPCGLGVLVKASFPP
ncbi:hypothetical protein CU254_30450 [Amycolatopsis sp. AA4]|nr:hypothetical protein CU254_30450 [Amycolatopsis sp. AA4]